MSTRQSALVLALLLLSSLAIGAQQSTPAQTPSTCPPVPDANGNLVTPATCDAGTPKAPAAKRFPYPGEAPSEDVPSAPSAQTPANPKAPAAKRFPYPGESDSDTPATAPATPNAASKTPLQDAGSSGESSSSSSSSASSSDSSSSASRASSADDPDANDPAAIPRRDRHRLPPGPRQTPSQREQEDVQVAGFYFNDGNYKGSYDRAKDAVSLDGEDAEAQLVLANAARKLGKLDEADTAYRKCLDLDPVPKVRKSAERALHEMTGR